MREKNHNPIEEALRPRLSFFSSPHKRVMTLLVTKCNTLSEAAVMTILEKMDHTDPEKRKKNVYDTYFSYLVPIMHKHEKVLKFLNTYGYVRDTYFSLLKEPEKNLELQRCICSVHIPCYMKEYRLAYSNLLCEYLKRYDLVPEIKVMIFNDDIYQDAGRVYKMFRK